MRVDYGVRKGHPNDAIGGGLSILVRLVTAKSGSTVGPALLRPSYRSAVVGNHIFFYFCYQTADSIVATAARTIAYLRGVLFL